MDLDTAKTAHSLVSELNAIEENIERVNQDFYGKFGFQNGEGMVVFDDTDLTNKMIKEAKNELAVRKQAILNRIKDL